MVQINPEAADELIERLRTAMGAQPPAPPNLPPIYGGGIPGGMEARVAVLEAHVEHIREDLAKLGSVPSDIAVLKERVSHLPTKGWMVGGMIAGLTAITALITFSEKLQALLR